MERALVLWLMQHDDHDPALYLAELMARPAWMDDAACKGQPTDLFFPARGDSTVEAKAICAGCPVRAECLEYALAGASHEAAGIWGGTSFRQRRKIRSVMARASQLADAVR